MQSREQRVASEPLRVRILRLPHAADLSLPQAASPGSAGLDLRAALAGSLTIHPRQRVLVPTGLVIELPPGFEGQVRPRSGWAWRDGLTVLNAPGTIDSDYRGEIQVLLVHLGEQSVTLERGDRIAQLVVAPVMAVEWDEGQPSASARSAGGFGSTGR
jgi:dUTP pyrophosphatase